MPSPVHGSHAPFRAREPLLGPLREIYGLVSGMRLSDHRTDPYMSSMLRSYSLPCRSDQALFPGFWQPYLRLDQDMHNRSCHILKQGILTYFYWPSIFLVIVNYSGNLQLFRGIQNGTQAFNYLNLVQNVVQMTFGFLNLFKGISSNLYK
jgi:hypothetical protein